MSHHKRKRITDCFNSPQSQNSITPSSSSSITDDSNQVVYEEAEDDAIVKKAKLSRVSSLSSVSKNCKSWVWNYFKPYARENNRDDWVVCMLCLQDILKHVEEDAVIPCRCEINIGKERGTTNMKSHIQYHHRAVYMQNLKYDESQTSILNHVMASNVFSSAIRNWVIQTLQPLSAIDHESFRHMIALANSKIKVPCRNTLTRGISCIHCKINVNYYLYSKIL
jgi:hypothetical protein